MTDAFYFGFLVKIFTVLFAAGLAWIALEAYRRKRRRLFFFISLAFVAYFLRNFLGLSQTFSSGDFSPITVALIEFLDLLTLVLIFFAVARE